MTHRLVDCYMMRCTCQDWCRCRWCRRCCRCSRCRLSMQECSREHSSRHCTFPCRNTCPTRLGMQENRTNPRGNHMPRQHGTCRTGGGSDQTPDIGNRLASRARTRSMQPSHRARRVLHTPTDGTLHAYHPLLSRGVLIGIDIGRNTRGWRPELTAPLALMLELRRKLGEIRSQGELV